LRELARQSIIPPASPRGHQVSDRLERMRRNPVGDWTIRDVEALCREYAVLCEPARGGGSHYKVAHARMVEKLTILISARSNRYISGSSSCLSMR
jgi:hypothetical protein